MKHPLLAPASVTALVVAAACTSGTDGSGPPAFSAEDSAGIALVHQRLDPTRALDLVEVWRAGSLDGDPNTQFFTPRDGRFGPNGEVYILDSGNHRVKVFSQDGIFLRSFGSQGAGPGEFSQVATTMEVSDDLVVVMDAGRRIHAFRPDGTLVATHATGPSLPSGSYAAAPVWGGDGWYLPVSRVFEGERREPVPRQPTELHAFDPVAGVGASTGLEWDAMVEMEVVGTIGWMLSPLFQQSPTTFLDGNGRLYRVHGQEYAWEVYAPDGTLLRRVVNDYERIPVTDSDLERYADDRREACRRRPNSECQMYVDEALPAQMSMPVPEYKAAVYQLDGSRRGDLLVLRADLGHDLVDGFLNKTYDLFAPDGTFRGSFTRTPDFRVIGMAPDRMIAVERDELDVESVAVYRIVDPT